MSNWNNRYFASHVSIVSKRNISALAILGATIFSIPAAATGIETKNPWPAIRPMHRSYEFNRGADASLKLTIRGIDNKPLYDLECHSAGYSDPDFDYSGDFECRLMPLYAQTRYSTLFTYDPQQSRDWESRARFLAVNLVGKCAKYPEFGLVRHFHLRGMKITLTMGNVKLSTPAKSEREHAHTRSIIKSFRFHIRVQSDSKATSEIDIPVKQNPRYRKCNESFVNIK
ncbi:MAG: hypothetical protein ACYDB9_09725 [Gammaproteobacteria bacterium]